MNFSDLIVISPLIVLFVMGLVPLLLQSFRRGQPLNDMVTLTYGALGVATAIGCNLTLVKGYWNLSGLNFVDAFSGMIIVDGITVWGCYIVFAAVGFSTFMLYDSRELVKNQYAEKLFLIMLSAIGMALMVMANDLFIVYLASTLMSLPLLLLSAMDQYGRKSGEMTMKFFVLWSFASLFYLYGVSFLYGGAGSTNIHEIGEVAARLYEGNALFRYGAILVIVGLGFQVAIFPFYSWFVESLRSGNVAVNCLLATSVKIAGLLTFMRFFLYSDYYDLSPETLVLCMKILAAVTMVGGGLAAVMQTSLRSMLAYSSVSHTGFALMAIIVSGFGKSTEFSTASLVFYLLSYSLMMLGAWSLIVMMERHQRSEGALNDLKGLGDRSPWLALCSTLVFLGLAGFPPGIGFFAKLNIFGASVEQGYLWLSFVAVLSSVLGVYHYLRPVALMYMSNEKGIALRQDVFFSKSLLVLSAFGLVLIGLLSSKLFAYLQASINNSL